MTNPKLSNTRFKLNEAAYFLDQVKAHADEAEAMLYNLSAFLSAARSVLWIMRKEFIPKNKSTGCRKWCDSQEELIRKMGFDEIIDNRDIVIHKEGHMGGKVKEREGGYVTMISGNVSFTSFEPVRYYALPIGIIDTKWVWKLQGTRQPVVHVCERFLNILSQMVEDCEKQFEW